MGNIGMGEIFVLLLVAMLIFGPNKLPEIARNLGKGIRAFQQESQKAAQTLRSAVDAETPPAPGVVDRPDGASAPTAGEPPKHVEPEAPQPPIDPQIRRYEDT